MRCSLTRKMFLTVGWANSRTLGHPAPSSLPSSSSCLEEDLWGEVRQENHSYGSKCRRWNIGHQPCAPVLLALPFVPPEGRPSQRGLWCSAPTSPGSSRFFDRLGPVQVKETSLDLLQTGASNKDSRSYFHVGFLNTHWHQETERKCSYPLPFVLFAHCISFELRRSSNS